MDFDVFLYHKSSHSVFKILFRENKCKESAIKAYFFLTPTGLKLTNGGLVLSCFQKDEMKMTVTYTTTELRRQVEQLSKTNLSGNQRENVHR